MTGWARGGPVGSALRTKLSRAHVVRTADPTEMSRSLCALGV
jgi:hypothetical protein